MIGIYKITNNSNGKSYIGQSIHIESRWKEHLRSDDNSIFHQELQNNPTIFTFSILEICEKEKLNEREQYWIQHYNSYHNGYNLTSGEQHKNKEDRNLIVPMEYIGVPLDKTLKDQLAKTLQIRDQKKKVLLLKIVVQ